MEMSAVEGGLPIPPGGSVALTPDGFHLMSDRHARLFTQGAFAWRADRCTSPRAGDLPVRCSISAGWRRTRHRQAAAFRSNHPAAWTCPACR